MVEVEFSEDKMRGAAQIALFMYGDVKYYRKVYHLAATSNIPIFKLGSMHCVRKSTLLKWIEAQEDSRFFRIRKGMVTNGAAGKVWERRNAQIDS